MNIRKLIKSLLFIFIVLSFAVLIYKEFSSNKDSNANDISSAKSKAVTAEKSITAPESRPSKELETKQLNSVSPSQIAMKSRDAKVIAYYFHGTFRCTTCRTIEQYSHDAIYTYFAKELDNGILEFRPVNVEEPNNRHFIQDYQLFSRSLVLSLIQDGKEMKWKNLTEVWKLVRDKDKFFQYVKNEVEKFLKET